MDDKNKDIKDVEMQSESSDDGSDEDQLDEKAGKQLFIIQQWKKQVEQDPRYYDGHLSLISALRESGELLDARDAREALCKLFPLTPEQWLEWIKDEQKVCTSAEEKAAVSALLQRAVDEYASVELWTEYLLHTVGGGDIEATRDVMEKALAAVGTNVKDGDLMWQAAFMVETQVFATLSGDNEEEAKSKQIKRMQGLTRRRFRVPVLNMDERKMLEEAALWFNDEIEPFMKKELKTTINKLAVLEKFEEKLLQTEESTESWSAFEKYLHYLKTKEDPGKVQNLYERAVLKFTLSEGVWEHYVEWYLEKFGWQSFLLPPITARAVRNCPWSAQLLSHHVTALQHSAVDDLSSLHDTVKDAVERGLAALSGVEESVMVSQASNMWLCYMEYQLRCILWDDKEKREPQLQRLRDAAQRAMAMMRNVSVEGRFDCDVVVCRLWAAAEAKAGNEEAARQVWNDVMAQSGYTGRSDLWLEFIALERRVGSVKHSRKLYRRALERVWEGVETVAASFKDFERIEGDLEAMADLLQRYSKRMVIVKKRRADIKVKEELQAEQVKANRKANKKGKQKDAGSPAKNAQSVGNPAAVKSNREERHQSGGINKNMNGNTRTDIPASAKKAEHFVNSERKIPSKDDTSDVAPPPGYPGKRPLDGALQTPAKKPKLDDNKAVVWELVEPAKKVAIGQESRTVFVSNLHYDTSIESVTAVFVDCGPVKEAKLVRDFKGRSKGFGFVVFENNESISKALEKDRTPIGNRPMFVSDYDPAKEGHSFKYSTGVEKDKLFIRGLPYCMKEADVKKAFESIAPVSQIRLVTHRNGYSKGTCFIQYADAATAEKVRQAMDQTELQGFMISVLISDPSAAKRSQAAQKMVGTEQGADAIGSRKPKLAFVPRVLAKKNLPSKKTENSIPSSSNDGESIDPKKDDGEILKPAAKSNEEFRKMFLKS